MEKILPFQCPYLQINIKYKCMVQVFVENRIFSYIMLCFLVNYKDLQFYKLKCINELPT